MFLCIKGLIYWNKEKQLSQRFFKHHYDIKNRSHNSEPAKYFHESHNLIDDPDVTILQTNIKTAAAQGIMWTNGFVNQKL